MAWVRKFFSSRLCIYLLILTIIIAGVYRYWGIPFRSAYRKYCWWTSQKNALIQKINILRLQVAQKDIS